jgi:predicted thioesterase
MQPGEKKVFKKIVEKKDTAGFFEEMVHPVYSTFSIARDAEWSGRLFVLELREDFEEGIGTSITVNHHAPAFPGDEVIFTATLKEINNHEIITAYEARVDGKLIASGVQGQKIFSREKLAHIFSRQKQ